MMKALKSFGTFGAPVLLMAAVLLVMLSVGAQAAGYIEGKHYRVISKPVKTTDPNRVEVVEAFGYWCPHCNAFEPMLDAWSKRLADDVHFKNMPVVFSKKGGRHELMARTYYAVNALGVKEKVHQPIYDHLHLHRKRLKDEDDVADFLQGLGVKREDYLKQMKGFAVNVGLNRSNKLIHAYELKAVPSLIINGKYVLSSTEAGSNARMLKVAEYLIAKERALMKKKAAAK